MGRSVAYCDVMSEERGMEGGLVGFGRTPIALHLKCRNLALAEQNRPGTPPG